MVLNNFSRINQAVCLDLLKKTHIVGIGAGGAFGLYEGLARTGLGKLTVFDFDEVEEVNLTRQGYSIEQIGKKKVDALKDHLANINQGLVYKSVTDNFLTMNKDILDEIIENVDLFLFLTDSFKAQSFGNKLALKYCKPAIWAGYYEKSHCTEIVFTIPGVTPSCFRCAVSPRYDAQKDKIEEIKISSNCNTIFHSMFLDSLIGMLVLAILHNNIDGYEYSNWFGKYWDRNLIQTKVHPLYGNEVGSLFQRTFANSEGRTFNFNSIFQKIEPECPPKYIRCPDCGGYGDLIKSSKIAN